MSTPKRRQDRDKIIPTNRYWSGLSSKPQDEIIIQPDGDIVTRGAWAQRLYNCLREYRMNLDLTGLLRNCPTTDNCVPIMREAVQSIEHLNGNPVTFIHVTLGMGTETTGYRQIPLRHIPPLQKEDWNELNPLSKESQSLEAVVRSGKHRDRIYREDTEVFLDRASGFPPSDSVTRPTSATSLPDPEDE